MKRGRASFLEMIGGNHTSHVSQISRYPEHEKWVTEMARVAGTAISCSTPRQPDQFLGTLARRYRLIIVLETDIKSELSRSIVWQAI